MRKIKWFWLIIIVYGIFILSNIIQEIDIHHISQSTDWKLIVVNRWNEIPDNYNVILTELSNGQKIDRRIYPDLQDMFDDARSKGIYPIIREGYRTEKDQQTIFNNKVQAYIKEGYSDKKAK